MKQLVFIFLLPFTLLLVTLPIYGLYEMSIWLCK